jgi:hypothetical protein
MTQAQEIADTLADLYATQSSDSNYDQEFLSIRRQADRLGTVEIFKETDQNFNETFNTLELHNTLSSCNNSSPRSCNIPYEMSKQLPPRGVKDLLDTYNYIRTHEVFPDQWHNAITIPNLKPNKDKTAHHCYRPFT